MNPVLRKLKIQIGIYHQDLDPHNYKDNNQGDKCYSWRESIKKNDSKAIQPYLKLSIKLGSEKKKVHSSEHSFPLDCVRQNQTTSFPKQVPFIWLGEGPQIIGLILRKRCQEANSKVHRWPNRPIATVIDSSWSEISQMAGGIANLHNFFDLRTCLEPNLEMVLGGRNAH